MRTAAMDPLPQPPRYEFAWATLVFVLAIFTLAHPALAGQFLAGPHSDQYIAGYAFREFAASHLSETGSFPQWNPYLFGGMPYVAAMHGDIFYPTFLLRLVLPTDVAMTWGFIVHLVLAGVFTFGFLRAAGVSFGGALIGGLAYMLGGQLASLVSPGHDGKLFVSALFPLSLWLLLRWVRDARPWAPGVLAVAVGLAVLSPHPQLLQYMLLASGAYALYLAIRGVRAGSLDRRGATLRLLIALGAVALGGLFGAIQYLPVREYVAWSPRAGGIADYAIATSYAWPPYEILDAYLPEFSGILDAYWGGNYPIHFHSQYVGASVLVLASAAFLGLRQDARRGEIWFWTGALIIALLWAFGGHTPFYRLPYELVPGTKFFRAPATVFFVGALAIAYLTAIGTERLLARMCSTTYMVGWGLLAAGLAVLASVGVLTNVAQTFAQPGLEDVVAANHLAIVAGAWRSLLAVVAVFAISVLLVRGKLRPQLAMWILALIVVADLWLVMRHYWSFSPPARQLFAGDATTEYLRRQEQPARVLALRLAPMQQQDANLTGDGLMVHDIRTTLGYHGNQLANYDRFAGRERNYDQLSNPKFWELTNTQYLLSNVDDLPLPGAERVAGPDTTSVGTEVSLFRLPGESPYAWVAPVIVKAPDEAILGTVLDPRFDPRTAALFSEDAPVRGVDIERLPPPAEIRPRVTRYEPGRIALELDSPAPEGAALVVSENYYPGWSASADGRPTSVGRVNYTFVGVELPAGARTIELQFDSRTFQRGKLITLAALGAAVFWIGAGLVLSRRRRGQAIV